MNYLKTSKVMGIIVSIFFLSFTIIGMLALVLGFGLGDTTMPLFITGFFVLVLFIMFFNFIDFLRLNKKNFKKVIKSLKYSSFVLVLLSLFNLLYFTFFSDLNFLTSSFLFLTIILSIFYSLISFLLERVKIDKTEDRKEEGGENDKIKN